MAISQNTLVIAAAALFFLFLAWKMRPKLGSRVVSATDKQLREARARARSASSVRDKAAAYCDAADIAASLHPDYAQAKAYLLRASRLDPTWVEPLHRAKKLLWRRDPVGLESLLWRVLARTQWEEANEPMIREALVLLSSLYVVRVRDRPKARALVRMLERLEHGHSNE